MAKKTNAGYKYEQDLTTDYYNFNAQSARVGSSGMDLSFSIKNVPINVELKYTKNISAAKILNYGQSSFYQRSDGTWDFVEKETQEEIERVELLTNAGILRFINERWKNKTNILEQINRTKNKQEAASLAARQRELLGGQFKVGINESRQILNKNTEITEEEYPYSNLHQLKTAINSYYSKKGADYVQISNFGFYRLGSNDPIAELSQGQLTIPKFEPSIVTARVRLKGYGKGKYGFTVALEAGGFPPNTKVVSRLVEIKLSENRKTAYKVGSSMVINLDNQKFREYLMFLNQTQS